MSTLGELIHAHHDAILDAWTREAEQSAAGRGLDRPEFQNTMPVYLTALADAGEELGRFSGARRRQVEQHLSSRLHLGFRLVELIDEFAILGRAIVATWGPDEGVEPPGGSEIECLFLELQKASAAATEMFTQHMKDDEQIDKRYQRLIQRVAQEALEVSAPALRERLEEVLALVMEAMDAQSTTLLLYDTDTDALELAASVGAADEELEDYVGSLDPGSFAGQVAAREAPMAILDVATTELKVSDTLRKSGIHALLGVRFPPHRRLVGVMYIGLAERRAFAARELRRLEALGMQLTLHLDNARLYAELREKIAALRTEREVRERFVSLLAHDLRGPLAAAKASAHLLVQRPSRLEERKDLAERVERNIDRTDRMIRDLLDTNRITAGEQLGLHLVPCDLAALAREVHEELGVTFGDRFVLEAEPRVLGFWSPDELRRALWNLANNAVKYGARDKPISLRVGRRGALVEASVHNWGNPISEEDQQRLFRPFSRAGSAQAGEQKGWGLGLTLVAGCAQAHGGRVAVESSAAAGTTFKLVLPLDSRPFQRSTTGDPDSGGPAQVH